MPNTTLFPLGAINVQSTTYTIVQTDETVQANAAGAAFTITLPTVASTPVGRMFKIIKTDSSANAVTIQRQGSSVIWVSGASFTSVPITLQGQSLTVESDGTDWFIVGSPLTSFSGRYYSTSAQSMASGSATTVIWNQVVFESISGSMNTATGVFTVPIAGKYEVSSTVIGPSSGTGLTVLYNRKNSTTDAVTSQPNNTNQVQFNNSCVIPCAVNDTIDVQFLQTSGSSFTFSSTAYYSFVTITRVGN